MSYTLPDRPSLEFLKSQAKDLLSAFRKGEPSEPLVRLFPQKSKFTLADAQLALAREYGFSSWPKLRAYVLVRENWEGLRAESDELVRLLCSESAPSALKRLQENPALASASVAAACACGEADYVEAALAAQPGLALEKVGPLAWEPLLYVCFSRLLRRDPFRKSMVKIGRMLLDAGADPNAFWPIDSFRETCLYGACGVADCPELTEMLLVAGADPNDGESMYHAMELPTPDCLRLLLRHGGDCNHHPNILGRLFDFEHPAMLEALLEECGDPASLPPVIPHALRRGRSASMIKILIESGAELNRKSISGFSPYQSAIRMGRLDVAELLEANGADLSLTEADQLIGKLSLGQEVDPSTVSPAIIKALDAERSPQVCIWAANNMNEALERLLAMGANVNAVDENGWTALHEACLRGGIRTVNLLLGFQADATIIEKAHNAPAIGFACYGSQNHRSAPPEDYVAVVAALLDHGAPLPEKAWGSPEVQEFLVSRGSAVA